MGRGLATFTLLSLLSLRAAQASADDKLVRPLGETEVDWSAGSITARGGAAADIRMPTADIARPGAERRARAVALAKLKAALATLPLRAGGKLTPAEQEAAVARARVAGVDYQSNGGVLLSMSLAFGDLTAPAREKPKGRDAGVAPEQGPPEQVLSVATMPLEVAPRLLAGEREAALGWAVYRLGTPPAGAGVIMVKRDQAGRLVLPKGQAKALQKLAGAGAVIYLQKAPR